LTYLAASWSEPLRLILDLNLTDSATRVVVTLLVVGALYPGSKWRQEQQEALKAAAAANVRRNVKRRTKGRK